MNQANAREFYLNLNPYISGNAHAEYEHHYKICKINVFKRAVKILMGEKLYQKVCSS